MNEATRGSRSKLQLWLIIGLTAAVFFGAFLIVPKSEEERLKLLESLGTSNRGTLLSPTVSIAALPITTDGESMSWQALRPKWRILLPVAGGCTKACKDMLYLTRQVHIRLDKKTHRVERVLLNTGSPLDDESRQFLEKEHPYLKHITANPETFAELISETNAQWHEHSGKFFLVDQAGQIMMFYGPENDGGDLLADLRHLLKYSAEAK